MKIHEIAGALAVWASLSCAAEPTRTPTPAGAGDPPPAAAPTPEAVKPDPTPVAAPDPAPVPDAAPAAAPAPDPKATRADPEPTAKSAAPVTIAAALAPGSAQLTLDIGADGTAVEVKVYGVDGLKVTKPAGPTPYATVRKGQSLAIAVEFTTPADKASNLAVSVTGTFHGAKQTKVQSFTVGAPAPAPATPPRTDKDGRKIKVMKSP